MPARVKSHMPTMRSNPIFCIFSVFSRNLASFSSCLFFHSPVRTPPVQKRSSASMVPATPSSFCISWPSFLTAAWMVASVQHARIAAPSSAAVTLLKCAVPTPHFSRWTFLAMLIWSPNTGVTTVGVPALRDAWAVPMPPWCTQQAHCGNSHSCGAAFMKSTLSSQYARSAAASSAPSSESAERSDQPPTMMPRCPASLRARTARQAM
mmetsp:Transcript_72175/g.189171  ORF Transcript_72175/g.189171 Transcript_72175/m.189171 type:complete len:208 (-) Transcript_72175:810-1433(-)